jgi:membrane protein required for colicin V production
MFSTTAAGFTRGFIKDFFSTCAWFGSGFIAVCISPYLIPTIMENIPNATVARCMAIGIAYLVVLVVLLLIISSISQNIRKGVLSGVDRAIGVLFGLFKGIGILLSFCILLIIFEIPREKYEFIKNSKLSAILFNIAELLTPQMSKMGIIGNLDKLDKVDKPALMQKAKNIVDEAIQIKKTDSKTVTGTGSRETIKTEEATNEIKSDIGNIIKEKMGQKIGDVIENIKDKDALKNNPSLVQKVKDFIAEVLSSRAVNEEITEIPTTQRTNVPEIPAIVNKPKYGSMSLLEARAKRRARRKKEKLKKEIRKHLDTK